MPFKPKVRGLAVIFTVKDLNRTQKFYAEVLGLTLDRQEGFMSAVLPEGSEILFFEGEATRGTSPQVVFGLGEGGIDSVAEGLVMQGVQLLTQVSEAPGGWSFEFRDPDDHLLAFYQSAEQPRSAPQ
ncbi:MAG TPA: VOC family protein [Polyangiaceae bacterium]|nr:VOC family protein [Polyangiaceae bacterium]